MISRLSLWRAGAVGPLDEAGTHRSDSRGVCLSAVEIAAFQRGEDVKVFFYSKKTATIC